MPAQIFLPSTVGLNLMYEDLSSFERALARFGDKVQLIVGLEISNKMTPEVAYQEIKDMMKELKKLRKKERKEWDNIDYLEI